MTRRTWTVSSRRSAGSRARHERFEFQAGTPRPRHTAGAPVTEAYPVRTAELGGGAEPVRLAAPLTPPRRPPALSRPFRAHEGRQAHGCLPPTGLQTVTWIIAVEVLHKHSLGNEQLIRRGALNHDHQRHRALGGDSTPPFGPSSWRESYGVCPPAVPPQRCRGALHHPALPAAGFGACRAVLLMGSLGAQHSTRWLRPSPIGPSSAPSADRTAEVPLEQLVRARAPADRGECL